MARSLWPPAADRARVNAADDDTLSNQVHSQKSAHHDEFFAKCIDLKYPPEL
jgi:hypothetical protein